VTRMAKPIRCLYENEVMPTFFTAWWVWFADTHIPKLYREIGDVVFNFDQLSRPIHKSAAVRLGKRIEVLADSSYYISDEVEFTIDPNALVGILRSDQPLDPRALAASGPSTIVLYHKTGFEDHIDNHEIIAQYFGRSRGEILSSPSRKMTQRHLVGLPDPTISVL
jgi:hypothetical protein